MPSSTLAEAAMSASIITPLDVCDVSAWTQRSVPTTDAEKSIERTNPNAKRAFPVAAFKRDWIARPS
jgi:hypothetical protein